MSEDEPWNPGNVIQLEDEDDEKHPEFEIEDTGVSRKGVILRKAILGLHKPCLWALLIGIGGAMLWCLVPLVGVLTINVSFIAPSVVGYAFAPLGYGIMRKWKEFAFAVIQLIVSCPYIQFYVFIIVSWIKQMTDTFAALAELIGEKGMEFIEGDTEDNDDLCLKDLRKAMKTDENKNGIPDAQFCHYFWLLMRNISIVLVVWSGLFVFVIAIFVEGAKIVIHILVFCLWAVIGVMGLKCIVEGTLCWLSTCLHLKCCGNGAEKCHGRCVKCMTDKCLSCIKCTQAKASRISNDEQYDISSQQEPTKKPDTPKEEEGKNILVTLLGTKSFWDLSDYIVQIHKECKGKWWLRMIEVWGLTGLNLACVGFDMSRRDEADNPYFVAGFIIRFLFIPMVSYCNIFTRFHGKPKSLILNVSMIAGICATVLIFILSFVLPFTGSHEYGRIEHLAPFDPNVLSFDHANRSNIDLYRCAKPVRGLDIPSIIGLTFGAYDVTRDATIFDREMGHFFGLDWKTNIDYSVHYCDYDIPFVTYDIKEFDTTVVAFRGFSSGVELGMWLEVLASQYVIPILVDMIPCGEFFRERLFSKFAHMSEQMGFHFFQPSIVTKNYIHSVMNKLDELGLTNAENVVFAGVNIGGTAAKVVGMMSHHPVVSFLSAPAMNALYNTIFDFENEMQLYVTNIYNENAMFSFMESGYAMNSALPVASVGRDDDENLLESLKESLEMESVYQSFCTLAAMCDEQAKYSQYCDQVVGKRRMEDIQDYFTKPVFQYAMNSQL